MHRLALSVLSGALLALAFPKFGHPAVAWIALVPWVVVLAAPHHRQTGPPRSDAFLGVALGAAYFGGTLYWIPDVLVTFGGLHRLVAIPIAGLLVAYLALFPALASWVTVRALAAYGPVGLWVAPAAWVASEWLRGWLFTGFPWVLLGASQVGWLPFVQTASAVGVWGVSAHIVAVNVAFGLLILDRVRYWRAAVVVAVLTLAIGGWGQWRVTSYDQASASSLRIGLIQGNVPQDEKWDVGRRSAILERYLRMSRDAARQGATLIVWPESATPFFFEEQVDGEAIRALARETGVWLLFGSDQIERGPGAKYYNAAFLVGPDGRTAGVYRKQHLVPFGEYVPLKRWLFFVAPLVDAVSDFSPGTEAAVFDAGGYAVSTAICYEVVFSDLTRRAILDGSQLLTTVTNDAWYGRTSAPWQHFDLASLRAIEFGRFLARAANTGVSGIVDPVGRVRASSRLFETQVLVADVGLLDTRTLYSKIGDAFAWACAALSVLVVVRSPPRGRFL